MCRCGGEEFAVIFCNTRYGGAKAVLEQVLQAFSTSRFDFTEKSVTFSCGLKEYAGSASGEDFFNQVDQLLYQTKRNGKNQVYTD